jgi:hydroxypyruvate isomerase
MPDEQASEVQPIIVDPHSMGVGDVTGPLGIVLAVVLGLDRFGLLRKSGSDQAAGGVPTHHRDEFVELRANVRHLEHRLTEHRAAHEAHNNRTAATLDQIREEIRRAIDRER